MDRSVASAEARKTPERLTKAQEAKMKHKLFFQRVENEVMRYKAVHRHHMQCLKVLMVKNYQFERKAKNEFLAALLKCEAEINATIMAQKESPRYTTVEELESKESKKENGKELEMKTSQKASKKPEKSKQQKISMKEKKTDKKSDKLGEQKSEQVANIKLDEPVKQTSNRKENVEVDNKKTKENNIKTREEETGKGSTGDKTDKV
ncbi:unnamed protein product [Onchocerca flexuosa]|uniref:HSA domain-containing protein n=1 Tax=Onchocerca flexuosa TaxID=387005 RepID=A0A183HN33_9BILA|nr:unnamed protein product [Onchocerca flexuosa]